MEVKSFSHLTRPQLQLNFLFQWTFPRNKYHSGDLLFWHYCTFLSYKNNDYYTMYINVFLLRKKWQTALVWHYMLTNFIQAYTVLGMILLNCIMILILIVFFSKISWYWYLIHLQKSIMILIHFKMYHDTWYFVDTFTNSTKPLTLWTLGSHAFLHCHPGLPRPFPDIL